MKQDEIIEMARQAGFNSPNPHDGYMGLAYDRREEGGSGSSLEAFAKLVAAKEREACAVVAEEWFCGCGRGNCPEGDQRAHDIADSIRARNEA
jgi:hypothetical protein